MGHAAFAEGIGEKLTPIDPPETWYIVLIPPCQVLTGEIFSHTRLTRDTPPIKIARFLEGLESTLQGRNDCELLVRELYLEVAAALDWLARHGFSARLTGTGCAVFAACKNQQEAESTLKRAQAELNFQGFVAKALNHSPLHSTLARVC